MSWGTSFCLITGASRGIGQAIAVEFSKKLAEGSVLLLLARTQAGLDETKKLIEKVNSKIAVHPTPVDLQKAGTQEYQKVIYDSLKSANKAPSNFSRAILIHNAANVVKKPTLQLDDAKILQDDLSLNFVSPVLLNSQFFKVFDKSIPNRTVVQVSSSASQMPCPKANMYASIKAGRDHFFLTLAVEDPTIRVLNYDPGAVDTDMLRRSMTADGSSIEAAKKQLESIGLKVIQPEETAQVLVEYLEGDVKSGAYVNVYKNPDLYKEILKHGEDMRKVIEKQ